MLAIYKRELAAYFRTVQGYLFMAIFLLASGFLFSMSTLLSQTSDTAAYFQTLMYGYIVIIPLLTMKSFAEEKKSKTEQLLLTSPVSLTGMVLAKFFAAFTIFVATVIISALYYIPLGFYGEPNYAKVLGCTVGMIFIGCTFIAIGIFISSLTENQFVAASATIGVLALLVVISVINALLDSYALRLVLNWISIYSRFVNFTNGIFDFSSAFYYLSMCAVFLFLTVRVYEKRRFA